MGIVTFLKDRLGATNPEAFRLSEMNPAGRNCSLRMCPYERPAFEKARSVSHKRKLVHMGLDAVEIVLRAEDFFVITIEDHEASSVRTVGDFYNLICAKLNVIALQSPVTSAQLPIITEKERTLLFLSKHTPLPAPPEVLPWSPQSVWDSLVAVIVDQQGLEADEILFHARFVEDLD